MARRPAAVPYPLAVPAAAEPASRRIRRLLLLGAAVGAVVVARDRLIASAERREATRLGLDAGRWSGGSGVEPGDGSSEVRPGTRGP